MKVGAVRVQPLGASPGTSGWGRHRPAGPRNERPSPLVRGSLICSLLQSAPESLACQAVIVFIMLQQCGLNHNAAEACQLCEEAMTVEHIKL